MRSGIEVDDQHADGRRGTIRAGWRTRRNVPPRAPYQPATPDDGSEVAGAGGRLCDLRTALSVTDFTKRTNLRSTTKSKTTANAIQLAAVTAATQITVAGNGIRGAICK